jgi:hypothetical protein
LQAIRRGKSDQPIVRRKPSISTFAQHLLLITPSTALAVDLHRSTHHSRAFVNAQVSVRRASLRAGVSLASYNIHFKYIYKRARNIT